ncbi:MULTISPECIES: FtsB family cell division protein [unclassified Streptomyces]|uniref:FtsB family cell division protein n=1 Tax=unclassified Streptomyces TaxID=2593676 RepID=UPI002E26BDB8
MSGKPELRGRAARLARLLPAGAGQAARTPFVLLVVLLLGGGLIGLLVLNSALSEGAFRLDDLQKETKSLTDEEQALQRDVDAYSAPDALQRRARELGMIPGGDPAFLDPDGTVKGVPGAAGRQSAARTPMSPAPAVLAPVPAGTPSAAAIPTRSAAPSSASATTPRQPSPGTPTARASAPSTQPSTTPGR